jgi:hypothetical protein
MESRLNLAQNSFAQILPATLPPEGGILAEDNQSASISDGIQQNTSLVNSSNIIQSALLPSQLPITPVSSTNNIYDDDDDDDDDDKTGSSDDDDDDDDDKTRSSDDDDDDDDDDKTRSSDDDDEGNVSNGRSVSTSSGGGRVSVSIR